MELRNFYHLSFYILLHSPHPSLISHPSPPTTRSKSNKRGRKGGRQERPLLMRAAAPWQQIKFGHPERSPEQAPGRQCLVRVRSIIENESAKRTSDQIDFFFLGEGQGLREKVMDFCLSLRGPFAMCIFPFEEGIATGQAVQDLYTFFFLLRYETHFLAHIKTQGLFCSIEKGG